MGEEKKRKRKEINVFLFAPRYLVSGQLKNLGLQSAAIIGDSPSEEAKLWQKQKADLDHCIPTLMDAEK